MRRITMFFHDGLYIPKNIKNLESRVREALQAIMLLSQDTLEGKISREEFALRTLNLLDVIYFDAEREPAPKELN